MPHAEWFIPRSVLFNAALYSISALIYTLTLFALEANHPGQYVFDPETAWRSRFSYLAICSWPILLFGALILVAVRIGARSRKPRGKRAKDKKKRKEAKRREGAIRNEPPSTVPPPDPAVEPTFPLPLPPEPARDGLPTRAKSGKSKRSRPGKRSVPRGYVSVTRPQRIFAAFGFLWVAVGLACTSACGALVFKGQRERYKFNQAALGRDDGWKSWVIPLITGGLPLVVYAIMAVSACARFYTTLTAKGRMVDTPAASVEDDEDAELEQAEFDLDVVFETPEGYPVAPPPVGRRELAPKRGVGAGERGREFGYRPDERTVERMMRQLRDMGFKNTHQNIAALEAASFDLEVASEKLANAQV